MKITFTLPGSARFPIGGYKVVFEYANELTARGHSVAIVLPAMIDPEVSAREKLYHAARYLLWGATQRFGPDTWFHLRPEVRLIWTPSLSERYIPDADVVIATGWRTAEYVAGYSATKGVKFYLIQHFESWIGPEARVRATWKLPLRKLVIANWLQELAHSIDETCGYVPNGLDFRTFGYDVPIEQRVAPAVCMLFHVWEWKGSPEGLQALEIARAQVPNLTATFFGVERANIPLPPWVTYRRNPPQSDLRAIYNHATVFLSPSWTEGCAGPPGEAMICGAAVVCTDIPGHHDYAIHNRTALLAPARDPNALGAALVRMLTDVPLRHRLAHAARVHISQFTWTAATDRLEQELQCAQPVGVAQR